MSRETSCYALQKPEVAPFSPVHRDRRGRRYTPVILGTMVTSGIELAATVHLAVAMDWLGRTPHLAIGTLLVFRGFDTAGVEKDGLDCVKGYARIENRYLYPPQTPGLGVELDEERVSQWVAPGRQILVCQ